MSVADIGCLVVGLGLVNWVATTIVVESELSRPLRDRVARHTISEATVSVPSRPRSRRTALRDTGWNKIGYLITCHLCAGTWIGLALAAATPAIRPYGPGLIGWLLTGLLIKAVGHLILVGHKLGEAATNRMRQRRPSTRLALTAARLEATLHQHPDLQTALAYLARTDTTQPPPQPTAARNGRSAPATAARPW